MTLDQDVSNTEEDNFRVNGYSFKNMSRHQVLTIPEIHTYLLFIVFIGRFEEINNSTLRFTLQFYKTLFFFWA